ncbi:MAG: J domain-containing protein [Candidatus Gygaella obscura]|nr:J domain-containing protein [Candidatus Gygaella obscura]
MLNFKQIDESRKLLGLKEEATFTEIKQVYRQLVLKYHPDRCSEQQKNSYQEKIKQINHARDIIMNYCLGYRFSFKDKEIRRQSLDEEQLRHLRKFYDGWWGDLDL